MIGIQISSGRGCFGKVVVDITNNEVFEGIDLSAYNLDENVLIEVDEGEVTIGQTIEDCWNFVVDYYKEFGIEFNQDGLLKLKDSKDQFIELDFQVIC